MKKLDESNDENFNMNDSIKAEISDFLPSIEFKKMELSFLHEHVVKRGYLFTYEDLSDILKFAHSFVKVKVTNSNGQSIYGSLPRGNDAVEVIKSLRNHESANGEFNFICWNTKCKVPSTPSPLKKRDDVKWYLIYFCDGDIGIEEGFDIADTDYLLAEMRCETTFERKSKCKIEIE